MSDQQSSDNLESGDAAAVTEVDTPDAGELSAARAQFNASWRLARPVLLLAAGAILLVGGAIYAIATKPARPYDGHLDTAERLIAGESYDEALDLLNAELFAFINDSAMTPAQAARARTLAARSVYLGQRQLGVSVEANNQNIISEYVAAENSGIPLPPADAYYLADTFAEIGRAEEATKRVDALGSEHRGYKASVYRKLADAELSSPSPSYERASAWIEAVERDTALPLDDQVWAIASRARIRLDRELYEDAVSKLVQALVRLESQGASRAALSELYVLLGEGYLELGDRPSALRQFEKVAAALGRGEPMRGRAELALARMEPETDRRKAMFESIVSEYVGTDSVLPALLGLAQAQSEQGDREAAHETYDRLIDALQADGRAGGVDRDVVSESLLTEHRRLMDSGDTAGALAFGSKIEPLYSFSELPDEVLTELALANRALADELLPDGGPAGLSWTDLQSIDAAVRGEAQGRLMQASRYFGEYARRVVLTDNAAYADALWQAARASDLGGDIGSAIPAYQEYAAGFPGDTRRFEASFRLAQAYHVTGQFGPAIELYQKLIDGPESDEGDRSAVLFGEASYVPLAQALLSDGDDANDARAEQLLLRVVNGSVVGPSAATFRDALFELSRLHFARGDHARAVERLTEAVERFEDDRRIPMARYRLAEAYRRLAGDMEAAITAGGRPDSEMQQLRADRTRTLREALRGFDAAIAAISGVNPRHRDDLERLSLRNAHFYRGDCAFDLGEYESAIRYYDQARDRYSGEPASLVAMVQIVNAHVAMGDLDRARTANARARRFFDSLPPDVWDDPYLPMDRGEWERWLDSTDVLYRSAEAGP